MKLNPHILVGQASCLSGGASDEHDGASLHSKPSMDRQDACPPSRNIRAFSLIEVMIALAIFFTSSFVILALVSSGLRTARMLRTTRPSASILAAEDSLTNSLVEGVDSGDFGNLYPDYNWKKDTYEKPDDTNGLWQIDYVIYKRGHGNEPESMLSIWRYSPGSKTKRLGLQP